MVTGKDMFSATVRLGSYLPKDGFAAARTAVLAFNVATMPPFATETVCCSMASWMATRSSGRILSISSMQAMPLSARTNAPASKLMLPPFSRTTAAVKPAAVVPLPEVYKPLGAILATYWSNCDLAVPGSPMSSAFISPLTFTSGRVLETPPKSRYMMASLTCSKPKIEGAMEVMILR